MNTTCLRTQLAVVLLVLVASSAPLHSSSACTVGPLVEAHTISVSVFVGESSLIPSDTAYASYLYHDSPEGLASFKAKAYELITTRLAAAGFSVIEVVDSTAVGQSDPKANPVLPSYSLVFDVYGYELPVSTQAGRPISTFLVSAGVWRDCGLDFDTTFDNERLGYATDSNLESRLLKVISYFLDEIVDAPTCRGSDSPSVYASSNGKYELFLTPPRFDCRSEASTSHRTPFMVSLFSANPAGSPKPISSFPLGGHWQPEHLLVSDSGEFIVTIGGSGDTPVTIYRSDGSLVRALSTADLLTDRDRLTLALRPREQWIQSALLPAGSNSVLLRLRACPYQDEPCDLPTPELSLDLETGNHLQPRVDLLPYLRGAIVVSPEQPSPLDSIDDPFPEEECPEAHASDLARASPVSLHEALRDSQPLSLPSYTEIAEKARIQGTLLIDLVINPTGKPLCARVVKGLPLGLSDAALETAMAWSFKPIEGVSTLRRLVVRLDAGLHLY